MALAETWLAVGEETIRTAVTKGPGDPCGGLAEGWMRFIPFWRPAQKRIA